MNSAVENSLSVADTAAPGVRSQGLHDAAIWGTTIFLSAFLLYQVQPLLAKIILPWFGGGAGVWITSLVFFQITYLLGNLYAYSLLRYLTLSRSLQIHIALLALSFLSLPILPAVAWRPAGVESPALRIFALLTVTI